MGFDFIFWLVIVVAIITGVVWFVRSQPLAGNQRRSTSLELLEERYARGEISREEYLQQWACLKSGDLATQAGVTKQGGNSACSD